MWSKRTSTSTRSSATPTTCRLSLPVRAGETLASSAAGESLALRNSSTLDHGRRRHQPFANQYPRSRRSELRIVLSDPGPDRCSVSFKDRGVSQQSDEPGIEIWGTFESPLQ